MLTKKQRLRRRFLKKTVGIAAGLSCGSMFKTGIGFAESIPDLVAVRNGDPAQLFDKAIEALGGMGTFVSQNQTVVIKPNIGWQRGPETGANTNPDLVKRIVEHVKQAGAKKVYVFDNSVDWSDGCYRESGIEDAVKKAGGVMVPGDKEKYYHTISIPGAERLKHTQVHELVMESDVYINVPVLKNHSSTGLTMAMKNQMGTVYDRYYFHRNDLHQCIADLTLSIKPDLNVMDAYRVTLRGGPQRAQAKDISKMKSLLVSRDMVALDTASTKLFGINPEDIGHISKAHQHKTGTMNLNELTIKKIDAAS